MSTHGIDRLGAPPPTRRPTRHCAYGSPARGLMRNQRASSCRQQPISNHITSGNGDTRTATSSGDGDNSGRSDGTHAATSSGPFRRD